VRQAKIRLGLSGDKAFIPLEPDCGQEAEADWGGAVAIIAGEVTRLKFFCMRSKYSGKHYVRFCPCERQTAFFDAHIQAFAFYGGVFRTLIYDYVPDYNMWPSRVKPVVQEASVTLTDT